MWNVFIDGSAGTTGLRIAERLSERTELNILRLPEAQRKSPEARRQMLEQADVAFLCLPDDAARESVALAEGTDTILIDTSTAHRTMPGWAYGFAELSDVHRSRICSGKRLAVPGCHASGFIALVYPLVKSGLVPADFPFTCFSLTGYSGGGNKMIAQYEDPAEQGLKSPRQYGTGQVHKHLPEMQKIPGLVRPPVFSPVVAPYYSGMQVTVPLQMHLLPGVTPRQIAEVYASQYANAKLVKALPYSGENTFLASDSLSGKDTMEVGVYGNEERLLLVSRFDNLGKGASGAAMQCMNLALGLAETAGLVTE